MYYHVIIEVVEQFSKSKNRELFELDKTDLSEIEDDFIMPFLKKEQFQFNGYFINAVDVKRLVIKETKDSVKVYSDYENKNTLSNGIIMCTLPSDILSIDKYTKDITKDVIASTKQKLTSPIQIPVAMPEKNVTAKTSVFIVHGHDELAKTIVARFLEKLDCKAIILHEQPSAGKTIIEKIETYTNVDFAIIIYTPDDLGAKKKENPCLKPRARQNVIFEHGYFIARLGRKNVCALLKGDMEQPSDISGIIYINFDENGAWQNKIAIEMRNAGYNIDMNRLLS